jgi:hypothetical protein
MTKSLLAAVVAFGLSACARTVSPGGAAAPVEVVGLANAAAPDGASLGEAENTWAHALRLRDIATLERLLAPEFRLIVRDQVTPRAEWLRNLGNFRVDSVELFHVVPRVIGDSGSVSLELYWHADVEGRPPINRTGVLRDTWRFRDGRWVVVERETLVSRPGYAPSPPY